MRRLARFASTALLVSLLAPADALAWNDRGHKAVAYIAYQNLSTSPSNNVMQRVDNLLMLHPRYNAWTQGVPAYRRGLVAFTQASVWPDDIKDYTNYQDCTNPPGNSAFNDTCRQPKWHYFDLPFSTDGTAVRLQNQPHAYSVILDAMRTLGQTGGSSSLARSKSYKLTWLTHLVGDIHQPLHATERFAGGNQHGDGGGNGYHLQPFTPDGANFSVGNLHSFWDNVLGVRSGLDEIETLSDELTARYRRVPGQAPVNDRRVWEWFVESHGVGRHYVYAIDLDRTGSSNPPVTDQYLRYAREIARQRVALAGYRLADLLNEHLR